MYGDGEALDLQFCMALAKSCLSRGIGFGEGRRWIFSFACALACRELIRRDTMGYAIWGEM